MRGPVSTQKIVSEEHCENSGCCEKLSMLLKAFFTRSKIKAESIFYKKILYLQHFSTA